MERNSTKQLLSATVDFDKPGKQIGVFQVPFSAHDDAWGVIPVPIAVIANGDNGVDGVSETDGLEVTGASLGAGLEAGAFVAQDGRNIGPPQAQNFKLVPWSAIAAKLETMKPIN